MANDRARITEFPTVPRQRTREQIEAEVAHHRANAGILDALGDTVACAAETDRMNEALDELFDVLVRKGRTDG